MASPNKAWAVVTLEGQVLVSNSLLPTLLGYSHSELRQLSLWDLVSRKDHCSSTMDQLELSLHSGESLAVSGRVVSLVRKEGGLLPVSLAVRELSPTRQLVSLEPVQQTVGRLTVCGETGRVLDIDQQARGIFQVKSKP